MKLIPNTYVGHYVVVTRKDDPAYRKLDTIEFNDADSVVTLKAHGGFWSNGAGIDSPLQFKLIDSINDLSCIIYSEYRHYYQSTRSVNIQVGKLAEELQELMQAVDNDNVASGFDLSKSVSGRYDPIKNTVQDELADMLILLLGICEYYSMGSQVHDIAWIIQRKMEYNRTRGYNKQEEGK